MLGFKKKNYLKRIDFIDPVDNDKIWSKSMTMPEIKLLLEHLENELSKYDYDTDKNFIMNNRRKVLKRMIEERLHKKDGNTNELVCESLFNFWEFVSDEYPENITSDCRELGISVEEFDKMDIEYREKGIICIQEKDTILEMIQLIINYINEMSKYADDNEKIRGSLYGFFVGDALGVPVEFIDRETLRNNPIRDMKEYGTHNQPKGTWSDDSSMVLATIDSMYNNKEVFLQKEIFNYNDLMNRYSMWKNQAEYTPNQKVFDIGITTADAISRYESNKDNVFAGNDSFNANGNGSLMRIIPLALYTNYCIFNGYTIKLLGDNYDAIKKFSSLTHAHTLSIMSCYIYNIFVSNYIELRDLSKAYIKTQNHFQNLFDGRIQKNYGDLELCKKYFDRLLYNDISKLNENDIKSSGFVVDTLEASFWCVLTSKTFEESVLKAVNLGDDTDTIGALTGALAGLVYGVNSIPKKWLNCLQRKEYLDDMVNKYIELIQLRLEKNEDDWQKSKDEYFEKEKQSKFQRVTKDDWNINPMTNNTKELKVDIKLTEEELEYIKLGHKPLEMEDHFFMYYDDIDNSINYYRSWTGIQVYKAYYNINTKSIDRLVAHLVEEVYNNRITDKDLIKTFRNIINYDIESRKKLKK